MLDSHYSDRYLHVKFAGHKHNKNKLPLSKLLKDSVHVAVSRRKLFCYVTLWNILNAMINT